MSYPKTVDKFLPWTKAMVAGATVGKPNYGKTKGKPLQRSAHGTKKRRRRRKKKRHAKE